MSITIGVSITDYGCGCRRTSGRRIGIDKHSVVGWPCGDCQEKMIGTRQKVIRYGEMPEGGKSYNYRDNKYEDGVSCYLPSMSPRPEFTEGRKKIIFSAIVIGWGGDDEPLIDYSTIIKGGTL